MRFVKNIIYCRQCFTSTWSVMPSWKGKDSKKKNGMMGGQIESKKGLDSPSPPFCPKSSRHKARWNFPKRVEFSRLFWWSRSWLVASIFCSETGNGIISRLRFYTCFIYCQSVINFCTMLFLSHHVYNGIIFILGDPISYVMFPVNSERSDWVRNLPFEPTN